MTKDEYKVELEIFEGPLDLLLYLIKKEEVDIYNIPIVKITTQYMEYLGLMRMLDLNIAGEFIVMAATLMMIKSRMLLPIEDRSEEEEEEDPRWDLVRQLVEYKKFKDAASLLQEREFIQKNIFGIGGQTLALEPEDAGIVLQDASLFDLIAAFNEVLKNARVEEIGEIGPENFSLADKIDGILHRLRQQSSIPFTTLFSNMASRAEIICTFLAVLELARLRQLVIAQESSFSDILVMASENDDQRDTADPMLEQGDDDV